MGVKAKVSDLVMSGDDVDAQVTIRHEQSDRRCERIRAQKNDRRV